MSIIQQIRERYAAVSIAVIALSLIGFILMDALSSRTSLFGGNKTTVGTVNGEKIDYVKFSTSVEQMEANYRNQGMQVDDNMRQQIIDMMWNNEIDETLLNKEYEKLGLTFSGNDLNEALYGQNPPPTVPDSSLILCVKENQQMNSVCSWISWWIILSKTVFAQNTLLYSQEARIIPNGCMKKSRTIKTALHPSVM
jgi:hypothetical protein